ncbi:MAG TPA: NrfD/PsrC family molybdoenzyme membrane anchor subunit [Dehalococcoidia bacterium]|nr:NrfD/PsrC family molybdoenzyme membrane anchor subunit [Dehalococcoidia bacterium]
MQEGRALSSSEVNRDLLRSILDTPRWFWPAVGILSLVVLAAAITIGVMVDKGLGITHLNRPVMWGFFITNFVFWIGISHAGVMLSAILRLAKAEWRRPATRAAEVLTIFSLMTAMIMPIIHTGRPWRIMYWAFPYDFARGIWPDIRTPLIWDPSAILTYLTSSTLFVLVALIPDFAVLRDHTTGIAHRVYSLLAMGWEGNPRQWKLQIIAGVLLSALILPVFVSVHSIVSWDFGMAVAVKSWHSTIFAPYFVVGAVHSGVSAVAFVMILLRYIYGWQDYIRHEHIDALGRLLIVVATGWFYFFVMEVIFGIYGREADEIAVRSYQFNEWPINLWTYIFVGTTYFLPVAIWLSRSARRNLWLMSIACISVNIGMWLERFLIIVPGLAKRQVFTFTWNSYTPSVAEAIIIGATFAFVAMLMLLFSRVFPLVPLYDVKEGEFLRTQVQVGRRTVPATFRED